ncbi:TPA: hypothetical protein ACQEDL_004517 [Yersinia enterocolitica]
MNTDLIIKCLYDKYKMEVESDNCKESNRTMVFLPLVKTLELIYEYIPDSDDDNFNTECAIKLVQLSSAFYVNNLRKGIESNFGINTEKPDDTVASILYTPQVVFYSDFFDLKIKNKENANKSSSMFISLAGFLSDNSYAKESEDALIFLLKNIGVSSFLSFEDIKNISKASVLNSYSSTISLLTK